MDQITAYEGKTFTVELTSMLGSTLYGWCLEKLPESIILVSSDLVASAPAGVIAPVIHKFDFGVISEPEELEISIDFVLTSVIDVKDIKERISINVLVIPSNNDANSSESFVKYSENKAEYNPHVAYGFPQNTPFFPPTTPFFPKTTPFFPKVTQAQIPYGFPYTNAEDSVIKYGYPCASAEDPVLKYGYPCDTGYPVLVYGVPYPNTEDTVLKYGYPCGANDAALKYGYPCGVNDTITKYGYPCGVNDATNK